VRFSVVIATMRREAIPAATSTDSVAVTRTNVSFDEELGGYALAGDERFGRFVVENHGTSSGRTFRRRRLGWAQFGLLVPALGGHRLVNAEFRGVLGLVEGERTEWLRRR
jgi:hypothetical protein